MRGSDGEPPASHVSAIPSGVGLTPEDERTFVPSEPRSHDPWSLRGDHVTSEKGALAIILVRMYSISEWADEFLRCCESLPGDQPSMNGSNPPSPKGRGTRHNPANRFETTHHELELDQVEEDDEYLASLGRPRTEYLPDRRAPSSPRTTARMLGSRSASIRIGDVNMAVSTVTRGRPMNSWVTRRVWTSRRRSW